MIAEITIGRSSGRNPVGAFKALSNNKFFPFVGLWGVICGLMILSFYSVVAGWAFGYAFEEIFYFIGLPNLAVWIGDLGNGLKNALISIAFMLATIKIITSGVNEGIERATKFMMPMLILIMVIMIIYLIFQPGASEGIAVFLLPDFSKLSAGLVFSAMGQAFFSLSLGMGALITYGSYLSKKENIPQAALFVTLADTFVAFLAGMLIIPAMYFAQSKGVTIYDTSGQFAASTDLVFQVLPALFHQLSPIVGLVFGVGFFFLLSIAALTSTISLLEVPTSYLIDEFSITRKKAARGIGAFITLLAVIISFQTSLIGPIEMIFSNIGLPLGGVLICVFIGYFWKTDSALTEMENGFTGIKESLFAKVWPIFIKFICPAVILYNLIQTLLSL